MDLITDIIIHPCPNFNDGLAKQPLKLGYEWVIKSHFYGYVITVQCPNLEASVVNLCWQKWPHVNNIQNISCISTVIGWFYKCLCLSLIRWPELAEMLHIFKITNTDEYFNSACDYNDFENDKAYFWLIRSLFSHHFCTLSDIWTIKCECYRFHDLDVLYPWYRRGNR